MVALEAMEVQGAMVDKVGKGGEEEMEEALVLEGAALSNQLTRDC